MALFLVALTQPSAASATFQPGVVEVDGYGWSFDSQPVKVPLVQDGESRYTVTDILAEADDRTSEFSLDEVAEVEINFESSLRAVGCNVNPSSGGKSACPVFVASPEKTTMILGNGEKVEYTQSTPLIFIPRPSAISVSLTPARKTIKSGQSVRFTASVTGASGPVTYRWNFGDGKTDSSTGGSSATLSHRFTGDDETFSVVLEVNVEGNPRGDSAVSIVTVGKVKKKPKKKPKENQDGNPGNSGNGDDSGGQDPGYDGGSGDDGNGNGNGDPSNDSPDRDQAPDRDRQVRPGPREDEGLETVSGQLVDPDTIAAVVPPGGSPPPGGEEAGPADEPADAGGGISDGAMAVLGIGALLGLGALAEAGAFAGIGRFRFRS